MTTVVRREWPSGYVLRVAGLLDPHWSPWFGEVTVTHDDDGTTTLRFAVADQAELHGILTRIRDLGVTLISMAAVDPPAGA